VKARRLLDALAFAGAILAGPLSRLPVRALGDEGRRTLPGDDLLPDAMGQWTNAITIRKRPADIWPWLAQMGCNRAGWYSYDGLDNGGVPSAERIVPELQTVAVGDVFPWTPTDSTGFVVRAVEPGRALVLGGTPPPYQVTWALVLEPIDGTSTRLITRSRGTPRSAPVKLLLQVAVHPIHFAMQRKQLLNVKRRVEARALGVPAQE